MPMKNKLFSLVGMFLTLWGISVAVLFLPYCGLYIMGFQPLPLDRFLAGTAVLGFVFALLLAVDKQTITSRDQVEGLTIWGLVHELFVRRKSLLALFLLAAAEIAIGTYYVSISLFSVEYAGESGIMIRLPGHTVYYVPISPYGETEDVGGWENTGIPLEKDETFTVEISGSVSPGFLQGLDRLQTHMRDILNWEMKKRTTPEPKAPKIARWDFTGPEGYQPSWYPGGNNHKSHIIRDYKDDNGLTIKGKTHNTVIGIILPPGQKPQRALGGKNPKPGYDWEKDNNNLLLLSAKVYPCSHTANRAGYLWVAINDADDFRWDNVGFFFLKLTRRPGPFQAFQSSSKGFGMLTSPCKNP